MADGKEETLGEIYAYGVRNPQRFSWDSRNGAIVWEGIDEVTLAMDTGKELPMGFQLVAGQAAKNLVTRLP